MIHLRLCAALLAAGSLFAQQPPAAAKPAPLTGPVYVLTHIDVGPQAAQQTVQLLQQLEAATKSDPDLVRFEIMVQDGRTNHLVTLEVWKSRDAYNDHTTHQHSKDFREKLQPFLGSPWDVRLHTMVP